MQKHSLSVKICSVVLSLLLIAGVCPVSAVIASAATPQKISSITIMDVETPRPGVSPGYTATYDIHCTPTTRFDDSTQMINGMSWRYNKVSSPTVMKKTDKFEKNVQYTVSLAIKVKDGYEFDAKDNYNSGVTAYVNGKKANVSVISGYSARDVLVVTYTFAPCDYFIIKTVSLTGIKVPRMGEEVSFNAATAGTGYMVSSVSWHDDTADKTLRAGDVFQAQHNYTLEIYVRALEGRRLQTDGDDLPAFAARINGVSAELITAETNGGMAAGFRITYSTDSVISKISVSDIEIPKAGNRADYTCKIDGIGYELDTYGIDWIKNGGWGSELPVAEEFTAGQSYELRVWLKAEEGFSFSTNNLGEVNCEVKINGQPAEVYLNATDRDCQITYIYTVPADITAVDITGLTEPFAGGTADMTAETSLGGYEIADIEWTDTTDGYGNYIYNVTSFSEGREYTANIVLKTVENNSFRLDPDYDIPDITAKINGKYAGVYSDGGRDEATIYFRFRTPVEVVAVTGIDTPVAGKAPDTEAVSTKAGYKINKIEWFDNSVTPAVKLSATDKFVAGHRYTVQITLYAINDFIFFVDGGYQEITGTINGNNAVEYGSHEYGTAVIGYEFSIPAAHTHTPSGWKSDKNGHWKECTDSSCKAVTATKTAHSDKNGDEKCDTCSYAMPKPVVKELLLRKGCAYTVSETEKTVIIPVGTKISEIKANILNEKSAVLSKDKKVLKDTDTAATEMLIQVLDKSSAVLSEYRVVVMYDADCDGVIASSDARLALRASVGLETLSACAVKAADIDNSKKIGSSDARAILRKSVGLD